MKYDSTDVRCRKLLANSLLAMLESKKFTRLDDTDPERLFYGDRIYVYEVDDKTRIRVDTTIKRGQCFPGGGVISITAVGVSKEGHNFTLLKKRIMRRGTISNIVDRTAKAILEVFENGILAGLTCPYCKAPKVRRNGNLVCIDRCVGEVRAHEITEALLSS